MRRLLSLYSKHYPTVLVYMLQNTEYQAGPYLAWYWRTQNFSTVMYRRTLHRTRAARMLLWALRIGILIEVLAGFLLIGLWLWNDFQSGLAFGLALIIGYPVVWAHLVVVPLVLGRLLIVKPKERRLIKASRKIFADFEGAKIAVAGSYGKTSMKELLQTILGYRFDVAATPANKNVSISHARFAQKLTGNEDVLIIEYGEYRPGDVAHFADITKPTHAFVTGLAPAHLDKYKTVHNAGQDIFSVAQVVPPQYMYVNGESPQAKPFIKSGFNVYDRGGVAGWRVSNVQVDLDGTRFDMRRGKDHLELHTKLLGRHHIGPLAAAVSIASDFGFSLADIMASVAKTAPFEHRMQPYELHGAWIIDDTYNGNLEGIRAGTELLKELPAKRKIYITPGLVDQGRETNAIHHEVGCFIAGANPDIVVLMKHSVTPSIQAGLQEARYKGEVIVESDPLNFYKNLQVFVAAGDVVMMQNDWPDNYL